MVGHKASIPVKVFIYWHCCLYREDQKVQGKLSNIRLYPTHEQRLADPQWGQAEARVGGMPVKQPWELKLWYKDPG